MTDVPKATFPTLPFDMPLVERISVADFEAAKKVILSSQVPVIFTGLCQDWPLVKAGLNGVQEAMSYLHSVASDVPVNACYLPPEHNGRVYYNEAMTGFNFQAAKLPLAQVFAKLLEHQFDENPPSIYMGSSEINHYFEGLAAKNSFDLSPYQALTSVWLGNRSTIAAHFDFPLNLACNVVGRRTFTLFPPEQVSNLYPGPMEFAPGGQDISLVDFTKPDFEKFPRFNEAIKAGLRAELNPGDVLYIPSMWWHHVQGHDAFNVLITHWWRDTPAYLGRPTNALLHGVMSLRSLPKAQRDAWKALFDYYVFDHDDYSDSHIPDEAKAVLTKPLDEMNARLLRANLIEKLKR